MSAADAKTHRGLLLSSLDKPLEVVGVPTPSATTGSVVVQVLAAYLPTYADDAYSGVLQGYGLPLPLVPGLSCVGRVSEIGSDATKLKVNDLVWVDPTVYARDDPTVQMLQSHFSGVYPEAKTLIEKPWRNGALQQFMIAPIENCFHVNEEILCGKLNYVPSDLGNFIVYMVAAGALMESASLMPGDTVIIGPATGSYGGAAVEVALALGAIVVALGRSANRLTDMEAKIDHGGRLHCVQMTGDTAVDAAAIQKVIPGGADVYNDWSPTNMPSAIYANTVLGVLKFGARIVLSGAAQNYPSIPYTYMLAKNLTLSGKFMYTPPTVRRMLQLVESGMLKFGERHGTTIRKFTLDEFPEAMRASREYGAWRDSTLLTPNGDLL